MILTYGKYLELLSALDEHCKGALEKCELQDAIFDHYMGLYGSFVAENLNKEKRLFKVTFQRSKRNKGERKLFRNFMNKEPTKAKNSKRK